MGGGVESPQGTDTPGVAEEPRGDKNPRVITAGASKTSEDGWGRGGDKKPPTIRANWSQGGGGRDDKPMVGPRTATLPRPQLGTAADDGSAGTPSSHTAGTGGARPEHGALVCREYGLLAPAGMVVDPADAGDTGSEAGHGATEDQNGTDP